MAGACVSAIHLGHMIIPLPYEALNDPRTSHGMVVGKECDLHQTLDRLGKQLICRAWDLSYVSKMEHDELEGDYKSRGEGDHGVEGVWGSG